jgi:hypothetical protein
MKNDPFSVNVVCFAFQITACASISDLQQFKVLGGYLLETLLRLCSPHVAYLHILGDFMQIRQHVDPVHLFHHYHERIKRSFRGRGLRPSVRFLEHKKLLIGSSMIKYVVALHSV